MSNNVLHITDDIMEEFATPVIQLNRFVPGSVVHVRAETNSATLSRFSTTIGTARFISYMLAFIVR